MNWIDIVILTICCIFMLIGLRRGIVDQIFSAAAIAGGFLLALILYDIAGDAVLKGGYVENPSVAYVLAFIVLFILTYLMIQILGWMAAKLIGTLKLSWINRLAGGALGLVIGILLSFLFISVAGLFTGNGSMDKSILVPYVEDTYEMFSSVLPDDLGSEYNRARELIREKGFKEAISTGSQPDETDGN